MEDLGSQGGKLNEYCDSSASHLFNGEFSKFCLPGVPASFQLSQTAERDFALKRHSYNETDVSSENHTSDTIKVGASMGNQPKRMQQDSQNLEENMMESNEKGIRRVDCNGLHRLLSSTRLKISDVNSATNSCKNGSAAVSPAEIGGACHFDTESDASSSILFVVERETHRASASSTSSIQFVLESAQTSKSREVSESPKRRDDVVFNSNDANPVVMKPSSIVEKISRDHRKKGMGIVEVSVSRGMGSRTPRNTEQSLGSSRRNAVARCLTNDDKKNRDTGDGVKMGCQLRSSGGNGGVSRDSWNNRSRRGTMGRQPQCGAGSHSQMRGSSLESRSSMPLSEFENGGRKNSWQNGSSSARQTRMRTFANQKKCGPHMRHSSDTLSASSHSVRQERSFLSPRTVPLSSPRRSGCERSPATTHNRNGSTVLHRRDVAHGNRARSLTPMSENLGQQHSLNLREGSSYVSKEELILRIDDEIDAVCEEIRAMDVEMNRRMKNDIFERLYRMNNRRDRDERRCRLLHYLDLEEKKMELLSQVSEGKHGGREQERRRAELKESARERQELFERLYRETPIRLRNNNSVALTSPRVTSGTTDNAIFERLYNDGLYIMSKRREREHQADQEQRRKEAEEVLHNHILARLEMSPCPIRMRTPEQMEAHAANIQRNLMNNPQQLREYLKSKRLKKEYQEKFSDRLMLHGYVNGEKLAKKKAEMELKECTFQPKINSPSMRSKVSFPRYAMATAASSSRGKRESPSAVSPAESPRRSCSSAQKRACEELYQRAQKRNESQKAFAEEVAQSKKLSLLKSKLKEDHHFRRRVELNPSLAKRYMASLVV